jgi:hypothetical protein
MRPNLMEKDRFLESLRNELAKIFGVENWWAQTTLSKIMELDELECKIKEAIDKTDEMVTEGFNEMVGDHKIRDGKFMVARRVCEKFGTGETLLEKLITVSDETVCNQFNLMSGLTSTKYDHVVKKMNVDLVVLNDKDKLQEMIELKNYDNNENPLSAMFQLICYYLFFCKSRNHAKGNDCKYLDTVRELKLTVLAPNDYYQSRSKKALRNTASVIQEKIKSLKKIPNKTVDISFQEFDIEADLLQKLKENIEQLRKSYRERNNIKDND